jgi:succinate dehydrogenase/fumarate reductase-like Fe-S protein
MVTSGPHAHGLTALVDTLKQSDTPSHADSSRLCAIYRRPGADVRGLKRIQGWVADRRNVRPRTGTGASRPRSRSSCTVSTSASPAALLDVCPQVRRDGGFIGAAAIGAGAPLQHESHREDERGRGGSPRSWKPDGIADCGQRAETASRCARRNPLTHAIARSGARRRIQVGCGDLFFR